MSSHNTLRIEVPHLGHVEIVDHGVEGGVQLYVADSNGPLTLPLTDGDRIAQWGAIDQDGDGVICLTRAEYPIATGGTEWADPTPPPVYPQVTP